MRMNTVKSISIVAAALVTVGVGFVAYSGQLDPPDGPVRPTGVSLGDLFETVNGGPIVDETPEAVDPGMSAFPKGVGFMFIEPGPGGGGEPRADIIAEPTAVFGFSHSISSPRDAASGLPTGRRQHKPFTITKPIDKASPMLMNMLVTNEIVGAVEVHVGAIPRGVIGHGDFISYRLVGARVVSVSPFTRGMAPDSVVYLEEVQFTYDRIIVTWEDGGITAEDDWETPVAD